MIAGQSADAQGRPLSLPAFRWPLRYHDDGSGRDLRLDFLRGWCLFSMVVDHAVGQHHTFLLRVTGGGGYPMTGAHGFVFLSGTVFGLVYGQVIAREGWSRALPKALRRGLTLYVVAVTLGFLGLLFSLTPWGGGSPLGDVLNVDTVVGTLTLQGANDSLMTLYFVLVLTAPLALYAMQRGKIWLVIAASLGLWLGHLAFPRHFGNPLEIVVPAAEWQVFFTTGLLVGYHRQALGCWLHGGRRRIYLTVLFTLFAALALLQVAVTTGRAPGFVPDQLVAWLASQVYTDYDHNPPLHVLAILVAFFALYHLVDWFWRPLEATFGWFLIPIGGATLYVYVLHTVVVYYVLLNVPLFASLEGVPLALALTALMLGFWVMVRQRVLFRVVPR